MTDLIMVQWADLTGTGFSPHERGSAPSEYWNAAEQLLQEDLDQPPENIRSTQGHPVWTLRQVAVAGRRRWCFVVQGRRGPFGVAGSCRFAFAPEDMTAAETWELGQLRAADPADPPVSGLDQKTFDRIVSEVLGGVTLGRAAVGIAADPGAAAAVVATVLRVLPEPVSRRWSWSTCLLQRPEDPELRVVSGQWPANFRDWDHRRAESVAHLFRRGPVTQDELEQRLARRDLRHGFRWLVEYAVTAQPIGELARTGPADLDDLLVELARANHQPECSDVPSMLESPGGRERLLDHLGLVTLWATSEPAGAVRALPRELPPELTGALLTGVLDAQSGTADNLLRLPVAGHREGAQWHDRLAALLREHHSGPELRDLVTRWATPGGPLSRPADLMAARAWLRRLGLDPRTDPALFPPDERVILADLTRYRAFTRDAAAEVELATDPLALLTGLVPRLAPLPTEAVAGMLKAGCPHPGARPDQLSALTTLAQGLTAGACADLAPHQTCDWADDLLRRLHPGVEPDDQRPRRVMYGVLLALLEIDPEAPRGNLVKRCALIGTDAHVPRKVNQALQWATRAAARPRSQPAGRVRASTSARAFSPATALPRRARLPVLVALLAAGIVAGTAAVVRLGDDDQRPARDRTPAGAASAIPAPPDDPDTQQVPLGPAAPAPCDDAEQIFRQLKRDPAAVSGLTMLAYPTAQPPDAERARLDNLVKCLRADPRLDREVPIEIGLGFPGTGPPDAVLRVTLYYAR